MACGGEAGPVQPGLGDDDRGGDGADAGDLIEPGDGCCEAGGHRLDRRVESGDVSADRVDPGEHRGQQEAMVASEVSSERLFQRGDLAAHH